MARKERVFGRVQSPTWGALQRMAESVIEHLGGPSGAANKLNEESFYALGVLASLLLDEKKDKAFIFGKEWLQ